MSDARIDDHNTRRVLLYMTEAMVFIGNDEDRCARCGHTASEDHRIPSGESPVGGVARCIFPASRAGFAPVVLCDCESFVAESVRPAPTGGQA